MAIGSSLVCIGRYALRGTSRARTCSSSFGGIVRFNHTPDMIYQTNGKQFTAQAPAPAEYVGTTRPNSYIPQWDALWGSDASNKTNIMRALSGLCIQAEDLVLKNPSTLKVLYAAAQDSGILNNDYYNYWWRWYRQGYIPGTDNFTLDRQYAHQRTASDDPVFKWGPWLSKWVQVNAWVGATYNDATKEIKISGSNFIFNPLLNGTAYKHPVAGNTGLNGDFNNYYDRGNLYTNAWFSHIPASYYVGNIINYKVFPGTGLTSREIARSNNYNFGMSVSDSNIYL